MMHIVDQHRFKPIFALQAGKARAITWALSRPNCTIWMMVMLFLMGCPTLTPMLDAR